MFAFLDQGLALDKHPYNRWTYLKAIVFITLLIIVIAVFSGLVVTTTDIEITGDLQDGVKSALEIIIGLIQSILFYLVTVRRAKDAGVSKYLAWLVVIPFVQYAVVVVFCLFPSKK